MRISKLTDYSMIIMALIAHEPSKRFQAREIAQHSQLALPTVAKLLKHLAKHQFLHATRGAKGGYQLAKAASEISVAAIISAFEGPIALTECGLGHNYCVAEESCAIRSPWLRINRIINNTLAAITLSDLVNQSRQVPVPTQISISTNSKPKNDNPKKLAIAISLGIKQYDNTARA